jgi:crossover junction endodeoxyribonuclease RusA
VTNALLFEPIIGRPTPQGSKKAFRNPHTGVTVVKDDSPRLQTYRDDIRMAAQRSMEGRSVETGPVTVEVEFVIERPTSHLTTKGALTKGAPKFPRYPDVDKTARAVLDALTGFVYRDDSQVVELIARKMYGEVGVLDQTRIAVYTEEDLWSPPPTKSPSPPAP